MTQAADLWDKTHTKIYYLFKGTIRGLGSVRLPWSPWVFWLINGLPKTTYPTFIIGCLKCQAGWTIKMSPYGLYTTILGAAPHKGILTLYWELPLTRGYWLSIESCPSQGTTDSILGAAPHKGLLTLYWELPLTRGYWLYIESCPSQGDTDSLLGAVPHEGILTLYWELSLTTRGH